MSGLLLGILLARTFSGLVADVAGWRAVYVIAAVLMAAQAVLLYVKLPRYQQSAGLPYPKLLASVLDIARGEPVLRRRALYGALSFASFSILWTTLAFLLAGPAYGYSDGVIGLFGLVGAAGALTASVVGRFTDRGWGYGLTGVSCASMLAGFGLLWLGGHHLSRAARRHPRPRRGLDRRPHQQPERDLPAAAGGAQPHQRLLHDDLLRRGGRRLRHGRPRLRPLGLDRLVRARPARRGGRHRALGDRPAASARRERARLRGGSARMNPKGTGMRFIDAHLHTDMIEDVQLQKLVMMGMEAAVIPSPHMFVGTHDADTVLLLWERFLTMETTTAKTLGYEAFTSISVPFFGVNRADAEKCLERMPEFLANERVVAMGEIGLDCGTEFEEWLFREHLRLAEEHDLPVILHTPIRLAPQGPTVTPRVFEIIKEEGYPVERCVFDHAGEETMDFRMSTGGMVGLSICWDKMPPEVAARLVIDHPEWRDRLIINSELGGMGNDYFMVPRVQLAMKLFGLDKETIDQVCFRTPRDFFKLPVD